MLSQQANATGAATGDRASCSDPISEYAAQGLAVSSSSLEDGGLRAPLLSSVGVLSYPPLSGWGNRMEARQGLIPPSQASLTACAHNSETLTSVLVNKSNNQITSAVCSLSVLRSPPPSGQLISLPPGISAYTVPALFCLSVWKPHADFCGMTPASFPYQVWPSKWTFGLPFPNSFLPKLMTECYQFYIHHLQVSSD